jgi:octaprenyl-diphosphate synthase
MHHQQIAGNRATALLLDRIHSLIGNELHQAEQVFLSEIGSRRPFVNEVLAHLDGYRGKRLRPMLVLLSALACGGIEKAHLVLAAVVEMVHTATLVHDDVLDEATTRRHVATINARWNNETSVLLGDYLFTHAFHLCSSLGDAEACRLIGRATNIVCEGEMAQVADRGNLLMTEEEYFEIIESKTAELCASSCYLGGKYAGASPAICQALDGYGRSLGIAFQIADDLLDLAGSEDATGKSLGTDLQKQKLTLPLIYLLARLSSADAQHSSESPSQAEEVRELISNPDRHTRARLAPYLQQTGALDDARARADGFALAAREKLALLPDSPARSLLEEIADFVTTRSA